MEKESLSRLKHFPIPLFAVVMGLSGLTIVFQKAAANFGYPHFIGDVLSFITAGTYIALLCFYFAKFVKHAEAVKKEFAHPIRINFFPAISICMLLLSIVFEHSAPAISIFLWFVGAPLHLFFTLYVFRFWIVNNLEINHSNPAWFIPVVGNVLVPITGVNYAGIEVSTFFFSIGMFFWVILFAIILNRIIFHHQMAMKFLPTLFIFIAPASVGCIAYYKINFAMTQVASFDMFAFALYDIGLFTTMLLIFMSKEFSKVSFAITWWAYTFPMAAITISTILLYSVLKSFLVFLLAQFFIIFTTILVCVVSFLTIKAMFKKEVCVAE